MSSTTHSGSPPNTHSLSSPPTSPSSDHVPLSLSMPSTSLKRKLTDRDTMHNSTATTAKKHRPSVPSVTITLKPTKHKPFASAPIPMPNACPDYPNGFIYCHQCSKKRDVTDAIQCTFLETPHTTTTTTTTTTDEKKENDEGKDKQKQKDKDKPPRQRRCVGKFCKFCLKNRYDLDFDDVVNAARVKKKEPGHVDTAGYIYKCPKCSETCNCPRCRKSKGLEPMGSAGTIRKPPPEPVPKPDKKKLKATAKSKSSKNGNASSESKGKGKGLKKPKPKPLPIAKWTPVPVNLSLDDAEARFHIREFVLRFADLMEPTLPKTNLEELEEIGGGRHQGRDESEEMVSWVSEFCVKSIIVGLLNLVAKELHGTLAATIKSAVKEIRNLGVNLNKIWPVLASLRDDVSFLADHSDNTNTDSTSLHQPQQENSRPSTLPGSSSTRRPFIFTFPDPLPPPPTHDIRNIRSTRRLNDTHDGLHITYSAQMVPVITSLIEDALLTAAVREDIEQGVREGKEAVRDQREAVKREAERWEQVRKKMETRVKLKAQILENRAKREYHKQKLVSLEHSLKILSPKFSPRLAPVGVDMEERVYWIMSPGVSEREAALDFIRACASDEKLLQHHHKKGGQHHYRRNIVKRAKVLGSEEERAEMRSWSWFVAVWGKKPVDATAESQKREKVKLKIKVNAPTNGIIKAKRRSESVDEEDMDVDRVEELLNHRDDEDEDEEMASVSDREEERVRDSDSSVSSSGPQSDSDDGEESDDGAKPASDETGSSSDEEEQSEEEQDEERDEEDEQEDNDRERWWGFYDPLEILKLSDWIAIKAGLDESDDPTSTAPLPSQQDDHCSRASSSTVTPNGGATPTLNGSVINGGYTSGTITHSEHKSRDTSVTLVPNHTSASSRPRPPLSDRKAQLKNLVDELRTFATLLEWRCREDKYELILRDLAAAAGGSSSVSVSVNGSVNGDGGMVKGQKEDARDGRSISVSSFYGNTVKT